MSVLRFESVDDLSNRVVPSATAAPVDWAGETPNMPCLVVIGLPRSGTSWLGKILDAHPGILYRLEPDSIERRNTPPLFYPTEDVDRHILGARDYLGRLTRVRNSKAVGSRPLFAKRYRGSLQHNLRLSLIYGLKAAERLPYFAEPCRTFPVPDLISRTSEPMNLVIKTIEATGRVNLYRAAWPHSRAAIILRHSCGQIASQIDGARRGMFEGGNEMAEDAGIALALCDTDQAKQHGLTPARFAKMSMIERLAWLWAIPNEKAVDDARRTDTATCCATRTFAGAAPRRPRPVRFRLHPVGRKRWRFYFGQHRSGA